MFDNLLVLGGVKTYVILPTLQADHCGYFTRKIRLIMSKRGQGGDKIKKRINAWCRPLAKDEPPIDKNDWARGKSRWKRALKRKKHSGMFGEGGKWV